MLWKIIFDATRITPKTQTIIDITLVSDYTKKVSGVLDSGISDHCVIYLTRKINRDTIRCHNTVKIRSLKKYRP